VNPLLWYVDGVKVYQSSTMDLYPIQFSICELPPYLRTRNIVVCGLWCDTGKPLMNTLLKPFVDAICDIQQKGGLVWKHPVTGKQHRSFVNAPVACGNAPCRADMQALMRHNAKHACNTCEQKLKRFL